MLKNDLQENARSALHFTCQLFYQKQLIGSGVLLRSGERKFLVSAKHVLPLAHLSGMMIPDGNNLVGIEGYVQLSALLPNSTFREDRIDLTIVELKPEIIEAIGSRYSFLDMTHVQIDHIPVKSHQYMISGFPNAWTVQTTDGYVPKPFILRTKMVEPSEGLNAEFPDRAKWFVDYQAVQRDVRTGATVEAPDPRGISGSGLWFIDVKHVPTSGPRQPRLVGIFTHVGISDHMLVATRIEVMTEVLRRRFSVNVPQPRTVNVNLH